MQKLALTLPGSYTINNPTGFKYSTSSITDIISDLLPYVFALAGIVLLILLIYGGIELLTSGGDPKKVESGRGRITGAVVGFIIIFVSYWIVQLIEYIFGVMILG